MNVNQPLAPGPAGSDWSRMGRWAAGAAILALLASGLIWLSGGRELLERLAAHEAEWKQLYAEHPFRVAGLAWAFYVVVTGLSLPGAAVLSLIYGWFFGFWTGLVLVSFGSTTGATIALLLSRFLFRDAVQRHFGGRLRAIDDALRREGPYYLFFLRLVVAVPFFVINLAMGLTPIRIWTFWWVSQLGMLPGTALYVYAGSTVPDLSTLQQRGVGGILNFRVAVAFALLGVFPLVVRRVFIRGGKTRE